MFQSQTELLIMKDCAAELDQLSVGEEEIVRDDDNTGASRENDLPIKELRGAFGKF